MRASPTQVDRCLSKTKRRTTKDPESKHRNKNSVMDASDTTKEKREENPRQAYAATLHNDREDNDHGYDHTHT